MATRDVENALLALKHRLYSNPQYQLIEILRRVALYGEDWKVILHKNLEGIPVGVAVRRKSDHHIQVFVRKACRGQGIGSKLVNKLKTNKSYGSVHSISNGKIFKYNGIRAVNW